MPVKKASSSNLPPAKPKKRNFDVPVDDELYQQVNEYTESHNITVASLVRAILRVWTNAEDPRPLPPGIEAEKRRPPRKRHNGANGNGNGANSA